MNTRELLDQDELWITADRMPIRLTEMDAHHRRCTLDMLRRRAAYQMRLYMWTADQDFRRTGRLEITEDPAEWLERRPLVKELARLVDLDEHPVVDGEVVVLELAAD